MMQAIIKYSKLARVTAWPAYSIAFLIPFAVGVHAGISWFNGSAGFLALLSFAGFAFALNFYSDRDTDRYHDGIQKDFDLARQPLVTGEVTERQCKVFCLVLLLLAILLSFLVGTLFALLVTLACLFGGVFYSHPKIRMKAKPLGDIICISVLGLLVPSAGYLLGAGMLPTTLMMLFWFLVTATGYIATVISDYEFDAKAGLQTTAVYFGRNRALKLMCFSCLSCLLVAYLVFRSNNLYPLGTRCFAVFSGVALVTLIIIMWRSLIKTKKMHLPIVSTHGRWNFIAPGIISLLSLFYVCMKLIATDYLSIDPFAIFLY